MHCSRPLAGHSSMRPAQAGPTLRPLSPQHCAAIPFSSSRLSSHAPSLGSNSSSLNSSSSNTPWCAAQPWRQCIQRPLRTASTPGSRSTTAAAAAAKGPAVAAAAAADGNPARAASLASPVVVVGGGPAGLATALMLARRGYTQVEVYERLPEPPAPDDLSVWADFDQASERLYMIGLNSRGQAVLRGLGVMDRIDQASSLVFGRMDWQPGTPPDAPRLTYYTNRTYKTRCIQRDRLASCLLQELQEKHSGAVRVMFNARCVRAEWVRQPGDGEVCRLTFQQQQQPAAHNSSSSSTIGSTSAATPSSSPPSPSTEWTEESGFVVGADGARSSLRSAMEADSSGSFSVRRFEDKNVIVYRTIPLFWPKELSDSRPSDVNYSIRTKSGLNLDCLPTREGPYIGVCLYKPGDSRIAALKTGEDVRALFQEHFPAFLPAVREVDLQRFADKADSSLPTFSYAGPVLHHGQSTCLVGDTVHTVKPYFGLGVNSAFEDVQILQQALQATGDDAAAAVQRYSQSRAKDAEALVVLSHSLDGGFFTFVGPLILDSLLNKFVPWLFSPNIIASLQNEKRSFSQIRARKRVDRVMQVALLAALAALFVRVAVVVIGAAIKLFSRVAVV